MIIRKKRINSASFLKDIENVEKLKIGVIVEDELINKLGIEEGTFRPNIKWGVNCRINTFGRSVPNKELPKESRFINTIEWHWKEYHGRDNIVDMCDYKDIYRDVYQRKIYKPNEVNFIYLKKNSENIIIADLDKLDINDEYKLKIIINMFLEIFGFCQFFDFQLDKYVEYKKFKMCNWEILPKGEEIWDKIDSEKYIEPSQSSGSRNNFDSYRIYKIMDKKPYEKYIGINEFQGYLVFIFKDICIFESQKYGNATYITKVNSWKDASQLPKGKLIESEYIIDRIIHNSNWNKEINKYI
ncbi:MAG: hypothetical protein K0R72_571 [Clostridia bacterium]|jgi:hypothetical protein|nr:hypothetical protein [Clostridia bacterium]